MKYFHKLAVREYRLVSKSFKNSLNAVRNSPKAKKRLLEYAEANPKETLRGFKSKEQAKKVYEKYK